MGMFYINNLLLNTKFIQRTAQNVEIYKSIDILENVLIFSFKKV